MNVDELTLLEQYACEYSDMYKDAYGFRPRNDTSNWTEDDFRAEFKHLGEIIDAEYAQTRERQERASHDFEMRIQSLMIAGAKDRDMALRWTHEAEGSDGDDEYLCYLVGLPYGYFKK